LCIGGAGLARGYLNQAGLTARCFVPDPFSGTPGARLYCTGDLVRRLPDGRLEFLGRTDYQVKIRGHRVEPGEIEAAIAAHPLVREALVLVREDIPGDQRLVAYLICSPGAKLSIGELRGVLRQRLPDSMLPAAFVPLDRWPLTVNGKVDRHALPQPDPRAGAATTVGPAPQSDLERTIAEIWQDVLRVGRVGLHDNFFDLGGNSLLLAQAHSRLRDRLGCDVSLVELFRFPTVGALAGRLLREDHDDATFSQIRERAEARRAAAGRRWRPRAGQPPPDVDGVTDE
jgi:hypothetical protein